MTTKADCANIMGTKGQNHLLRQARRKGKGEPYETVHIERQDLHPRNRKVYMRRRSPCLEARAHTEEEWSLLRDEAGEYYVYAVGGQKSFWAVYIEGAEWDGETILPLPTEIGKAIAAEYREGRNVCFDYIKSEDLRYFYDSAAEVMVCGIGVGYKNLLQIAA